MGAFGAGGLSWAAGVGQADLAARGQGPVGLAGLLGEQAAAFGRLQERVVDLAVVEGAGGDQVVEVAGRLPQLAVALADRGGGDAGELLGQGRPRIAVSPGGAGGRKLDRASWPRWRSAFQPARNGAGTSASGVSRSRPGPTGRGGRRRGGWVGRPHSRPGPASPHAPARPGGRCRGRWGPGSSASHPRRCGPAARSSAGHGRRPGPDGVGAGGAVDVQDVEAVAGGQADVGLGVAGPPGQDPGPVGGGVLDPVGDEGAQGVLAGLAAARIPTRAARPRRRLGWSPVTGWRSPWWGRG